MSATPYEALLVGGPHGIAARIIGAVPRKLTAKERRDIKRLLSQGHTLQVLSPDRATWDRVRPGLCRQLGLTA